MCKRGTKGAALFVVLAMLLVLVIMTNVIMTLMLNQSHLGYHQTSRIQAYYAAQAGMNYALEQLRTGAWPPPAANGVVQHRLCNGCTAAGEINEPTLPAPIQDVIIRISGNAVAGCTPPTGSTVCISVTTTYINPP